MNEAETLRLVGTQNVNAHLRAIYAGGELAEAATCMEFLQVRREGERDVSRSLRHYRLEVILAVGYRVRSLRNALSSWPDICRQ
jgi:hypothetical protein